MPEAKEYRFIRFCAYEKCRKEFGTNREWQRFCPYHQPNCRLEYHKQKKQDKSMLLKEMFDQKKQIEAMQKDIESIKEIKGIRE